MRITEIFFSIQGESTHAGRPCIFVRLTGCSLRCVYCDTKYSYAGGREMSLEEVLSTVASHPARLVEVTGGEPLEQEEVYALMDSLLGRGYAVVAVDPHRAAQFRRAQGRKAKTDRLDARSPAGMLGLAQRPPLAAPDPVREELRELTRFRHDLVRDRTALINSLHEALTVTFPEFAALVSALNSPTTLTLVLEYPTPALLKGAGVDCLWAGMERRHGSQSSAGLVHCHRNR